MSFRYRALIRSLLRFLTVPLIAGGFMMFVGQTNGAAQTAGFVAPIGDPVPLSVKAGYSVVCNSVVKAETRGGRFWTTSRTYRLSTASDGGKTTITYDVLKHEVKGDVRQRIEDAGSGFRIALSETGDVIEKDVWVNPDFRWGNMQRKKRIAGLDREINLVVGVTNMLRQGEPLWHEKALKEMATGVLVEFDPGAKLKKFSDGTTVRGIGTLEGEKVIVIEGILRQSGFARGRSLAIEDQIHALRYLDSGLPAGGETSRSINNGRETSEGRTTCVQTQGR